MRKGEVTDAYQVTMDLSDEATRRREVRGLVQCCRSLGLKKGQILTYDSEELFESDGIEIEVVPVWRYFSD